MTRARVTLALLLALAVVAPACASADALVTVPVGTPPLSDAAAAARVHRSAWEPRPQNAAALRTTPTAAQLADFRARSDMPYRNLVTGAFTGTTDEVLQWAAAKWGLNPDLVRAVASVESWWLQSTNGDSGDSFGLMQMRRPWHCCLPIMQRDAAFNVDYWAAIVRSYYDGRQTWLKTTDTGRAYAPGKLWHSVGAWYSGAWSLEADKSYVDKVRSWMRRKVWLLPTFLNVAP